MSLNSVFYKLASKNEIRTQTDVIVFNCDFVVFLSSFNDDMPETRVFTGFIA